MKHPDIFIIVSDSLRQDHVGYYAGDACPAATPNIDALLRDSVAFDNMYPEGLPTIPVRTEWATGNGTLAGRSWRPLAPTDVTCAEILRREGYSTAFITDVYHYFKPDMNFHRGFMEWQWIRGQEFDACQSGPPRKRRVEDYWKDSFPENWRDLVRIVCQNLDDAVHADDFPCAQTFQTASNWIQRNQDHSKPLFLWVETFDPHEPWTPPAEYDLYRPQGYSGKDFILPPGGSASDHFTDDEIRRVRSLYAGEVTYVDAMAGRFIDELKRLGRYDDSLILFLSDHGHPLADHGKFLKGCDRLYSELLKVPFAVKLPGNAHAGKRIRSICQFPDVLPTLLCAAGLGNNAISMQGHSLLPLIQGDVASLRPAAISGFHDGPDRCIRDETWSLVLRPDDQADELYNLKDDPRELHNVIDNHPDVAQRLISEFGQVYSVGARRIKGVQGRFEVEHTPV
jgi:arylsulfatase A-like enzyme